MVVSRRVTFVAAFWRRPAKENEHEQTEGRLMLSCPGVDFDGDILRLR